MDRPLRRNRLASHTFAGISALLAIAVPVVIIYAKSASDRASSNYGNGVDSGAYLPLFALFYLLPASGLFAAAAVAHYKKWPDLRAVKWLAIAWLAVPSILLLVTALFE